MEAVIKLTASNQIALVCGASQGIGEAAAHALAEMGCRVIAMARRETRLALVVQDLPGTGHHVLAADIGDRAGLIQKLSAIMEDMGPITILVNNTGGPKGGPIAEAQEDSFLTAFQNHILSAQALVKLLLPGMKERGFGRVVNVISTSVKAPIPNLGVSNTIRGAMANWAKTLSMEVAPFGITVNNVLPGYTDTPRLDALLEANAAKSGLDLAEVREQWRARVPARRFATPEETAAAVAFLASDQAGYITGINLPVDGGRTPSL